MSSRLKLFGCAVIDTPAGPLEGRAAQRHRIALLALLATTRRPSRSRDSLIAMLWPEADSDRGRRLLSDSVYRINQALGDEAVVASADDLRLNTAVLPSDVAEFERAVLVGEHEHAAALYLGSFLDGFHLPDSAEFEQWLTDERSRYAGEAARSIEALAEAAEEGRKWTASVAWWRRAAALAPDSSRIALRLMHALEASGDRATAIRHAAIHGALVRESLGIEPDAAIERYAASLRADVGRALSDPVRAEPSPDEAPSIAPTAPASAVLPSGAPESQDRRQSDRRQQSASASPRIRRVVMGGVAALVIAAAVALLRTDAATTVPDEAGINTIAVLPFQSISPSESTAYFADGMTEELSYMLGRDSGVRVLSRTSAFAYRDSLIDVREIGRRLGVAWVVEGSVRRGGPALRITARLTNARNGYQVWSETFDRTPADVFSIQEEIASAIAGRVRLGAGAEVRPSATPVAGGMGDPVAYDLYLRGRYHWHRRTEHDLRQAAALLEQSVERAPGYARGWAGLGDAYAVLGFYDHLPPAEAFPRAEAAALRALSLDERLAGPHATIGYVNLYYRWNWSVAEASFRRSIEMEPTYSTAHQWLGNLLTAMGRFDEAADEMRAAQQLDPLSLIANAALGWVFLHAGRYDQAVLQCQRTLALDPNFQLAHMWMGLAESERGRHTDAVRGIRESVRLTGGSALPLTAFAYALARSGARDSARAVIDLLLARARAGQYIPSYELAKAHLALGDTAGSLSRLERAFEERAHSMAFLRVDPQLAGLRREPRYRALVRKVGLDANGA